MSILHLNGDAQRLAAVLLMPCERNCQIRRALPDGSRPVAYTRIDVDFSNLASARELLQANLPWFGAPAGTEIHYTVEHHRLKGVYGAAGLVCGQQG